MKHVSDITQSLDPKAAAANIPPAVTPIKVDPQTAEMVNVVFAKLQGIFPAWRQAWPDQAALERAQREWIAGFVQGGINSDQQLAYGFRQARKSANPFMPSVGEFVAWCTPGPEAFGMPPKEAAWVEALMGVYSHEGVRFAAEATGTFDLRQAKQEDKGLRQRFEYNYAIVIRRAQAGQQLCGSIAKAIAHKPGDEDERTPMQRQLAHSHQEARDLITAQNIPTDGKAARALLLARFSKRRA